MTDTFIFSEDMTREELERAVDTHVQSLMPPRSGLEYRIVTMDKAGGSWHVRVEYNEDGKEVASIRFPEAKEGEKEAVKEALKSEGFEIDPGYETWGVETWKVRRNIELKGK